MTTNRSRSSKKRKQSVTSLNNPANSHMGSTTSNVDVNTEKPKQKIVKRNTDKVQVKNMNNKTAEQPKICLKNLTIADANKQTEKVKIISKNTPNNDINDNKVSAEVNKAKITPKKRKKTQEKQNNGTVTNRNIIDANWQEFLAQDLNVDPKGEAAPKEIKPKARRRNNRSKKQHFIENPIDTSNVPENTEDTVLQVETKVEEPMKKAEKNRLTRFIAMDTEMVGIGMDGRDNMVARVSLVNKFGDCIYDKFVKPREPVIDYRTSVSGVRREDLINGESFDVVQKEVSEILRGKILVGHSLKHDLNVLYLSHPRKNIRDTTTYKPFRKLTISTPSLKRLTKEVLGVDIQSGEHSSVEDAKAVMKLYCTVANKWEENLAGQRHKNKIRVH